MMGQPSMQPQPAPPMMPGQPMMPGPPMAQPPSKRAQLLLWGSALRIIGAVIGGLALIWLGIWIANPLALVNPFNPLAPFQTLGTIIVLAGLGAILINIGWAMQTWAVGLILSFDR